MSAAPSARRSALFVLYASAAFATASPLARWARPAHPLFVAFGRLALATLLLSLVDLRHLPAAARALAPKQRLVVFGAGAILAAHFVCFLWGLDNTSLPAAVSLVSLEPLGVVVCAWALLGIAPRPLERAGVLLAAIGAAVVARGAGKGEHRLAGDLAVLAAVVLYGLYLTVARALKDALPPRSYATLVYASAALTLSVALLFTPSVFAGGAWPLPPHAWIAIVALAVIPTVLGHTAVQSGSRSYSPAVVALVSPGETIGSLAIGAALLRTVPSALELGGAAVILLGSALAMLGARSAVPQREEGTERS